MSTATRVPQTRTMRGEELSADDARTTLRRHGGWRLLADSFMRFRRADGFSHARALAFQVCLAILPLAIALVGLSRALGEATFGRVLTRMLHELTPGSSRQVLDEAIRSGQDTAHGGGELALWIGLGAAVVALTTAMGQVERGGNRLYGIERDRPLARKYGRALAMALTAGLSAMLGFLILVAGGAMTDSLAAVYHWDAAARTAADIGRWPVGALLAWASFTVLFARSPRRQQPGYSWLAVGAGVSLVLWVVFTALMALYVGQASAFGSIYGPLTGVIALLLWANLTSIALFVGLAFAAQLEAVRAHVPGSA